MNRLGLNWKTLNISPYAKSCEKGSTDCQGNTRMPCEIKQCGFSFPPESLRREEVNENDRLMFKRHNLIILAAVKKRKRCK